MKCVRIVMDQDPMSPREWDNAGRMICWHNNYNLGDDHDYDCADFLRQLAFEADSDCEDTVDYLEGEAWTELFDEFGSEHANRQIDGKVAYLIESTVREGYVILPLYLMDHSGITMSTGAFSCPWDSGQVGWIICDNETIEREFNDDRDLAEKCLESEVSVYDDYLTGNVFGFIVEEDGERVDSCFGFFGSDVRTNGMAEHLGSDELIDLAEDAEIEYP